MNDNIKWVKHVLQRMFTRGVPGNDEKDLCPVCGGIKEESAAIFAVDYKAGVLVIRNVSAAICLQRREEYTADKVTSQLEEMVALT